jgi:hypothetical protein
MLQYKVSLLEYFTNYIHYIVLFFLSLFFLYYLYFKGKHKFWLNQVIYNKYDPRLWNKKGFIVGKAKLTKYYNSLIYSDKWKNIENEKIALTGNLLSAYYNYYKDLNIIISTKNVNSMFDGHNNKCYISLYFDKIKKNKLIGCLLSKPIEGRLYNNDTNLYLLDYICNNKDEKDNVYFELLYTHFKRQLELNNKIFMFKTLTPIEISTSLLQYNSFLYSIKFFPRKIFSYCKNVQFVTINSGNYRLFIKIFYELYDQFDCFLHLNLSQLMYLCDKKIYFITLVLFDTNPVACYFFKDTFSIYNNKKIITLLGSYRKSIKDQLFLEGFYNSIILIYERIKINYVMIEDLGLNHHIIDDVKKYKDRGVFTTYYYYYNYLDTGFEKSQVLLML